jgi:DamX protein
MAPNTAVNSPVDEGPGKLERYFSSPELAQRADLLRHLTENSNLIPLIRGGEGIGKSAFVNHLLELAPENWMPAHIAADVMLQPEALLAQLAQVYGLDAGGDELLHSLALHFDDLRQDGFLPVIIVDDAHLLPESSVITLLRLHQPETNGSHLAQVLLFAQPEIDNLLDSPQLKAMNLQSLQLLDMPVFTREQTERFLGHLLAADETVPGRSLPQPQVDRIFRDSGGVPGAIKRQAALLTAPPEQGKTAFDITEYLSLRNLVGGGLVLVVVLLGLAFQDDINSMFGSDGGLPEMAQDLPALPGKSLPLALPDSGSGVETANAVDAVATEPGGDKEEVGAVADVGPSDDKPPEVAEVVQPEPAPAHDVAAQLQLPSLPDVPEQAGPVAPATAPPAEPVAAPKAAEPPVPDQIAPQEQQAETRPEKAPQEQVAVTQRDGPPVSEPVPNPADPPPGDRAEMQPEKPAVDQAQPEPVQQSSPPAVPVKAEPEPPRPKKPVLVAKPEKRPAPAKVKKPTAGNRVKASLAPPGKRAQAPVVKTPVEERSSGLVVERPAAPAPVEERSTHLVKRDVPAVKLTQTAESGSNLSPPTRPVARVPKAGSPRPMREAWLLKQRPASYTIQLVGLQEEKGVSDFLRRQSLVGPVAYYRTVRSGKPWYPVLHGVYSDRKNAIQARDKLPKKLRKSGVWLRTMGSVQKEIRGR